ncbi:MAG TPA: hypothetical protein VLA67_02530, partial [Nitrospiraceae bacterium]|nr:hypothetical protein [Nitrospiraceae bacterium]
AHVVGLATTLQAVHQDHRPTGGAVRLPVTEAEQLGMGLGREEAGLGRDAGQEGAARPTTGEYGHEMGVAEPGRRGKIPPV